MTDMFDKTKRSDIMSKIRSKNTVAEVIVFKFLVSKKIYFQKHYEKAPGKPDIALPRKKKAVFIDGDFWHGRTFARIKNNRPPDDYWVLKISGNILRDKRQRAMLKSHGWKLLQVWETDIKRLRSRQENLNKIQKFLAD